MKRLLALILLSMTAIITGCSDSDKEQNAVMSLDQTQFSIVSWDLMNSHVIPLSGKIMLNEKPVEGVHVQIDNKRTMTTNENGEFEIHVDQSTLEKNILTVVSTDNAKAY